MSFFTWLSFTAAAVLLTLAPGPDILFLISKSLSSGRRSGIRLAAGLSCGAIFHTGLVMLGVASLIQSSPVAFRFLTMIGASYLLYLAWRTHCAASASLTVDAIPINADADRTLFVRGFLMNALNPKVLLFFLALFPQFITPDAYFPPEIQVGLLGLTFAVQAFFTFSLVSVCANRLRLLLLRRPNFPRIMNHAETGLLILIAVGLLLF